MDSRTKLFHLSPLQRRVATVLSWGLAFLMIASADPALAGNATPQVYGQTHWKLGSRLVAVGVELSHCRQSASAERERRLLCRPVWQGLVPRRELRRRVRRGKPGGAHLLDQEGQGDFLPVTQWNILDTIESSSTRGLHRRAELSSRREREHRRHHKLDVHSRR